MNIHEVTSWTMYVHEVTSWLYEYSWSDFIVLWIIMKWRHKLYKYSWSDVMDLLNIHKVTSWTEYLWSDIMVLWIFMKWLHRLYIHIHDVTSLVLWIFTKWHYGSMNIHEVTSWVYEWSWSDVMVTWIIMKWRHCYIYFFMNWRDLLYEYSWSDVLGTLNIHELTSWQFLDIHKMKLWVLNMNIHEVTSWSWTFMKWRLRLFECSWIDVVAILNIHKMKSWVLNIYKVTSRALNINKVMSWVLNIHVVTTWVFYTFMKDVISYFE